ncbi:hypothetical protein, partial [Pseudomonas sp. FSL R10-1339]
VKQDFKALESDDEETKAPAIIDLLFNIALVLLHVANKPDVSSPQIQPIDDAHLPTVESSVTATDKQYMAPVEVNVQQGSV